MTWFLRRGACQALGGIGRPLTLALAGALALSQPARAYDIPSPGVVCDRMRFTCYDSSGPSVSLTRRWYGQRAEQDLLRRLSGKPPSRDFQLSGGEVCDTRLKFCWTDGWRRSRVDERLTRQLFGDSGGGWNPGPARPDRVCALNQRGRRLFQGGCQLSRGVENGYRAYVVETRDNRRYAFVIRSSGLTLRDATGTWPVRINELGDSVVFSWTDLQLQVSRPVLPGGPGMRSGPASQGLQGLMESLFP